VINPAGYFASHTFASADLDSLQIFFIVLSFFLLFIREKPAISHIYLSYLALALGYFSKGPFVLLPLCLNTIFLLSKGIGFKRLFIPLILFSLPILSWHMLMSINYGLDFWDSFINYHVFSRSLIPIEGHEESVWFYFLLLLDPRVNLLGTPFFIKAAIAIRYKDRDPIRRYTLLFCLLSLIIFTLIATKIAWYILPVYPFLVLFLIM
jgi:4-amino-4-deoxy-L-arabinose transferase-like glycosyltransferase